MKHYKLLIGVLFTFSLMAISCQSNGSDENTEESSSSTTTTTSADNAAAEATEDKIVVEGPNGIEVGTLQKVGEKNIIYCGGNKFESLKEGNKTTYILNDGNEIYTLFDRGSSFDFTETSSGRVLWRVFSSEGSITLKNEFIPESLIIRCADQSCRLIYANKEFTTVTYKDGTYTSGTPQGNIIVRGQPSYSRAFSIIGAGFAVAPPHQMIILAELLDKGL
ncbi:MAG: hypothetical protein MK226_22885 [Saprospiraceae bacterium]|nr:hypothetical protein [Saprospiraceae bacterium]